MKRLWLFNPENDIALGRNLAQFTPPRQAALLHRAGAAVAFWLGDVGDWFLVGKEEVASTAQWIDSLGIDGPEPVISAAACESDVVPTPWGWSRDAVRQFVRAGVPEMTLKDRQEGMEKHRLLSHRRTSLKLLQLLDEAGDNIPSPLPIEAATFSKIENYVGRCGRAYLKSPWSSSGRGVFPADAASLGHLSPTINGIIRAQGSVMVEPALDKIADFAMLFFMKNGQARFYGLSFFENSTAVNYGGNLVSSDEEILNRLSQYIPKERIESLKVMLADCLEKLLGNDYEGPLGVDILLYREQLPDGSTQVRIDPAVELNLRYTMGFVARGVFNRLHKTGWMRMTPKAANPATKKSESTLSLLPDNPFFSLTFEGIS